MDRYTPVAWPQGDCRPLDTTGAYLAPHLAAILATRRSRRDFVAPATKGDLSALFDLSARTQEARISDLGFDLEFRRHPASGAIHSIHCLVQERRGEEWNRYDAKRHELVTLRGSSDAAQAIRLAADEVVPTGNASLIAFIAEPGKTAAKYDCPESLIWRDAGVMLGYISIAAEALGLGFCPLGITGDPMIANTLDQQGRLRGVGLALLGRLHLG
ncbi:nitroreductase family protein [Acidovorax sp. GBBC 1281]